jgi:hypothetical protein
MPDTLLARVTMPHRDKADAQAGLITGRTEWRTDPRLLTEWDADTDVMPVEYCRILLEISRQLK